MSAKREMLWFPPPNVLISNVSSTMDEIVKELVQRHPRLQNDPGGDPVPYSMKGMYVEFGRKLAERTAAERERRAMTLAAEAARKWAKETADRRRKAEEAARKLKEEEAARKLKEEEAARKLKEEEA
ncbi:hypothetical protein KFL_006770050, partial [Klebsormidium nitens]